MCGVIMKTSKAIFSTMTVDNICPAILSSEILLF